MWRERAETTGDLPEEMKLRDAPRFPTGILWDRGAFACRIPSSTTPRCDIMTREKDVSDEKRLTPDAPCLGSQAADALGVCG